MKLSEVTNKNNTGLSFLQGTGLLCLLAFSIK